MIRRHAIAWTLCATIFLSGCASTLFNVRQDTLDEQAYTALFPWYAEFCAVSEIRKKPDFGARIVPGGPGGHSLLYLNGVCRVEDAGYPEIAMCDADTPAPGQGVGLSVNDHFSNTNWIATEGRDFFYHGDLAPGESLTREAYARTQTKAEKMGILDGVTFHDKVFADQPAGMSKIDFMYDMSVSTDYAANFGRDRYCARVPLDRAKMARVVTYLNAENAPYRSGQKMFEWNVLQNNCAHLAHNALASVGFWSPIATDRPLLIAAFDFPVPKNEFVNLMRRTNDMVFTDPHALYDDEATRSSLPREGWIATGPGGLAEAERAVRRNEVYDTNLRLIFYDEPVFGHYQQHFEQIFNEPRYTNLAVNLSYFSTAYAAILANRPPDIMFSGKRAAFDDEYYQYIAAGKAKLDAAPAVMAAASGRRF
jgi:hypothetical protein